jgi:putative SOS response-associated peptidase YedK
MCGRFFLARRAMEIAQALGLPLAPSAGAWRPRYNIAPTQDVLAVVAGPAGPVIEPRKWGLIPHWARDAAIGNRMINARLETIATKPAYSKPLRSSRCVVLADGFFEWKQTPSGKIPVAMSAPEGMLGFAGIWAAWTPPSGDPVQSCTIITREAAGNAAKIHGRMPAILPRSSWEEWVSPRDVTAEDLVNALMKSPPPELRTTEVSPLVNNPRNDSPEILKPAQDL